MMRFNTRTLQNFSELNQQVRWDSLRARIQEKKKNDVEVALAHPHYNLDHFMTLLSPAAESYLDSMMCQSRLLTRQRFGRTVQLFVPLYLSNKCHNVCTYCGFSLNNPIRRTTLSLSELSEELSAIQALGFRHIVLLTGEAPGTVGMNYFCKVLPQVKRYMAHVSMEVQPLAQEEYCELMALGLDAVYIYQETYHRESYARYHLRGNKTDFDYRLNTADRLGRAGIKKIGLAALIGLSNDWRVDVAISALHLTYLQKKYWRTRYSISIPRLRPCAGGKDVAAMVSNRQMLQLVCAWRLVFPEVELSLSTRESPAVRNQLLDIGITSMSAGSSTQPGGYAKKREALAQFEINDTRPVEEIVKIIKSNHFDVIWQDRELSEPV